VVGQTVLLDNLPFTLVGVALREFFGADPAGSPDLYFPMHAPGRKASRIDPMRAVQHE
jgi:macrolide transport system ATP-binding/permease protein